MIENLFRKKTVASLIAQAQHNTQGSAHNLALKRVLTTKDLIAFGLAAIVGAGIFSTIGSVSASGGPAVIFLFVCTAIVCSFAAFCYAEFASMVPVSGSAYTYSYLAFGELVAWIMGWALIMEYTISNSVVALSWSSYFTSLLGSIHITAWGIEGLHLPTFMTTSYLSVSQNYQQALLMLESGMSFNLLADPLKSAYQIFQEAPGIWGLKIIFDLPALCINALITLLAYRGISASKQANNLMVLLKVGVIIGIVVLGAFYIDTSNWDPFAPNGISGVLKGISGVFFAYIGFDAVSTTAEECENPQRDLPRGIIGSVIACAILYVAVALVLTGMTHYDLLGVGDPLAFVFARLNMHWVSGVIAVVSVVAMTSALLVYQLAQPRIWLSMSRDGLFPKAFARVHPVYKTPSFATIATGFAVMIPCLFLNFDILVDLTSMGTLFAFTLVCGGVLRLGQLPNPPKRSFKTPYINARYILPVLLALALFYAFSYQKQAVLDFVSNKPVAKSHTEILAGLSSQELYQLKLSAAKDTTYRGDLMFYMDHLKPAEYQKFIEKQNFQLHQTWYLGTALLLQKLPFLVFLSVFVVVLFYAVKLSLSLIPVLGMLSCLYMMSELGLANWLGFGVWLAVGLLLYALFGYRHSKLRAQ